uniref:neuron navigator 3-like n=1 Tax=Styela clava TaxID=7725 RepID=UPI001939AF68|nr:neuron navigator 3-like [Styela clava]
MVEPQSGRRFLRPPSTVSVSRKSQSFNAADRNKINKEIRNDEQSNAVNGHPTLSGPTNAALMSGQTEWRSKSMNAKHSFTYQSAPAQPSKLAKKGEVGAVKSGSKSIRNSPTHLIKVENGNKVSEPTGKQKLVKMRSTGSSKSGKASSVASNSSNASSKVNTKASSDLGRSSRPPPADSKTRESRLKTPVHKTPTKGKSGLMPPRATVSRSASNSSRSSTATTASPDRKANFKPKTSSATKTTTHATSKSSSSSVLGRLRKMGGPSGTTIPNDSTNGVTLKQAVAVKSPTENSKSFSRPPSSAGSTLERGQKKGLVPPSKLSVSTYKSKNASSSNSKNLSAATSNGSKQGSGIKSTFQKAFGQKDEKNIRSTVKLRNPGKLSPELKNKTLVSYKNEVSSGDSDVIIITNMEDSALKRYSGEESVYRRDKIDVKNLKNLLVRPYDNARTRKDDNHVPGPIVFSENEIDFSDSEDFSKVSMDVDLPDGLDVLEDNLELEVKLEPDSPPKSNVKSNHESGIRNIQLPTSAEERNPLKTATVAPFRRQIPTSSSGSDSKNSASNETPKTLPQSVITENIPQVQDLKSANPEINVNNISVNNTPVSIEERRKTAKGIADLRQNLEETMCSLRSSQLRNRFSDEFERRISAQLDNEIEDIGLPEVPPPLTNGGYRSASTLSGIHTISHSSRSPKLHAGECFGSGSYTSPRPNTAKFSSLQRTSSNRSARSAWSELPDKHPKFNEHDDISSVSSEDISELITGISTDDISLSSTNNSPFHVSKPSSTPLKKSSLARKPSTNSVESCEKSSNSTTESNRSLSSWKKSKSGSKSDGEGKSKKKLEKKNSKNGKEKGSSAVGSRLATMDRSESPTSSSSPQPYKPRDLKSYRSLPRTKKSRFGDLDNGTPLQNTQEGFVRSPALKILLRSKANKAKVQSNLSAIPDGTSTQISSNLSTADPYTTNPLTNGALEKPDPSFNKTDFYNSLERKNSRNYGLSLSATQSLPRRFARKAGNTTWSQPRSNANSAYSLPVTPDSLYDQYGSYIDNSVSCSESASSFSNLTVPEFDSFNEAMDRSYDRSHKVADWPLSGLQSSSVAASSPNVSRAAYSDRNYRTISSTHDLMKRRGSTLSLGGASNQVINDETSIAMARSFLFSLAQNKAVQQAHMVHEFEKSLSHLTNRLQELSTTAEEKDTELNELRNTIEMLKNRSALKSGDWESTRGTLKKKPSCASLSSMSSQTSVSSAGSNEDVKSKKKKGWLKSSFKNAFGRTKSKANLANGDAATSRSSSPQKSISGQEVMSLLSFDDENCDPEIVRKLKEELRQKERKLTDIRLEALTSRHQLQHLQDTMSQMKNEMESLRKENEQLHQLGLSAYSLTSSSTFLHSKLNSTSENIVKSASDEIRVKIVVQVSNFSPLNSKNAQCISINVCPISRAINWNQLDQKLIKIFMAYCQTVDPTNCIKLTKNSIEKYSIGDGVREVGISAPELLPCGYLVGGTDTIVIQLQDAQQNCVDLLAFELLIDKTLVEKYVNLIFERKRVIICGPVGSGKTLLANRLAGHIADISDSSEPVVYMDAKQKAISELQDFLDNMASSMKRNSEGTTVIVLDNLQSIKSPKKLLEPFCQSVPLQGFYLICVTNRKSASELQEFCWITCNNNSPPVQTLLARKLRRSYLEHQITQNQKPDDVLSLVITWLPKCWQHINDFLELHSGPDVTIGPRMFSSCPMDASSARVWFTDLWNFSVVPYVITAVKRSTTRRNSAIHWSDPTDWVLETMPWRDNAPNLLHIRAEDIGPSPTESDYSGSIMMSQSSGVTSQSSNASQSSSDPLLNMLMRLQEAANYDSDTNSSHDENFELSIDKALTELGS